MRRTAALLTVLSVMAAGLGCKHVAGKCDCQANPNDAILAGPSTPYPAAPIATVPTAGAPAQMPPLQR